MTDRDVFEPNDKAHRLRFILVSFYQKKSELPLKTEVFNGWLRNFRGDHSPVFLDYTVFTQKEQKKYPNNDRSRQVASWPVAHIGWLIEKSSDSFVSKKALKATFKD